MPCKIEIKRSYLRSLSTTAEFLSCMDVLCTWVNLWQICKYWARLWIATQCVWRLAAWRKC